MPTFVWQRTARDWAPSLFWGELPREMTAPENRGLYVFHPISELMAHAVAYCDPESPLDYLAKQFPKPQDTPNAP